MIRPYEDADFEATGRVWYRSGMDEYDYLPMFQALSEDQALEIFRNAIVAACEIWVSETAAGIDGFMALNGSYIDRLYIDPARQRSGLGASFLDHAKRLHPAGLSLHTHQANQRARAFYEKHGFVAVEFGISPPPESVPDVRYQWGDPVG